ncbi:MAG: hypothetical protein Q8867_01990 [Bacteroidota bacterium]|nr:hypothetical protein [Bacteroidota bacterium]
MMRPCTMNFNVKQQNRLFFLISLLLWIYLWLRAIYIPVAHDEVATFFFYVHTGNFLPFLSHWDANNHFLNSALTYYSYRLFGSSPLALRLPNLLFAPLFFYYCYKISQELSHTVLRWVFFLSLSLSHSMLEFFALSRGYGMSMALLFAAVYYLIRTWNSDRIKYPVISLMFIMLATFANMALINTYLILTGIILLKYILRSQEFRRYRWQVPVILFAEGIIPVIFFAKILLIMQQNGNLYAGSGKGFWQVTVVSLSKMLSNGHSGLFCFFALLFFLFSCFLFFRLSIRKDGKRIWTDITGILFLLLLGNIIATLVLGFVFHVNFPEDRIALYFFVFLIISFLFLLDRWIPAVTWHPGMLLALPFLIFPIQFLHRVNLTYLSFYISDNIPPRFYEKVYSHFTPGDFPPTIGGERLRHFCWSYLNFRHGGSLSEMYYSDFPGYAADYQIVTTSQNPRWTQFYTSIDYDKYSGRELLKRKNSLQKEIAGTWNNISTGGTINREYFTLFEMKADQLKGKPLYLTLDLSLESEEKPFVAWIVTTVVDDKGNTFSYERLPLDCMRTEWKGPGNNLKDVMLIPEVPSGAMKIVTYVWNMESASYRLKNGTCSLYTLVPDWKP